MRALVTGGAGFIGSNLAKELCKRGFDVTIIDSFYSSNQKNLEGFKGDLIRENLADFDLKKLESTRFDAIFHQGAITDTTVMDKKFMFRNNVFASRKLFEFAAMHKIPCVYASSAGVYGNNPVPMKESDAPSALNPYALSKCYLDNVARRYIKEGARVVGLRYFNVYGPGEAHKRKFASMIWQLAAQMRDGKRPRIFKYGEQARDFVYVKDVVEANLRAYESKKSGIVNVGTGKPATFNGIVKILNQVLGTRFEPEYFDNPYGFFQNCTQADTHLADTLIGFKARFLPEEGIQDYYRETSLR